MAPVAVPRRLYPQHSATIPHRTPSWLQLESHREKKPRLRTPRSDERTATTLRGLARSHQLQSQVKDLPQPIVFPNGQCTLGHRGVAPEFPLAEPVTVGIIGNFVVANVKTARISGIDDGVFDHCLCLEP